MQIKGLSLQVSLFRRFPVLSIMSGGALAQGLQLLAYPVIARLFLPQELGSYWSAMGVITVLVAIFTLQLEGAILGARSQQVPLLMQVVFWILGAAASIILLLVVLLKVIFPPAEWSHDVWWLAWYCPIALLTHGMYAVGVTRATRFREYSRLGLAYLTIVLVAVCIQIVAGYAGLGVLGLVLGDLLARLLGVWVLLWRSFAITMPQLSRIRRVLVRFRRFPLLMGPATILNTVSQNFQSIFFPLLFGNSQAGQLGMATRLAASPAGLVTGAVSQVFSGELAARREQPTEQRRLVLDTLYLSTMVALPFGIGVAVCAEVLIPLVLGDSWRVAGEYASILSAGIAMSMIVSPISSIVIVRNSLSTAFFFALAELFMRGLPFALAAMDKITSPTSAVVCISVGNMALYALGLARMARLVEVSVSSYCRRVGWLVAVSLISFAPAAVTRIQGEEPILVIVLSGVGLLVYLVLVSVFRPEK
ncbi:MAG: hypothetical protein EBR49_00655 [Betaproteobacteria bacterium]|nr:hypothetical protein [Betaproteobacteria bacterium]